MLKTRNIIMDAGQRRNTVNIYDSATKKQTELTFQELADLPLCDSLNGVNNSDFDKVRIISENAHLIPRGIYSIAQILTRDILDRLIKNCKEKDIELLGYSEKLTPRALTYANLNKDTGDCEAIDRLLNNFPKITMRKLKTLDMPEDKKICIDWRKNEANQDMNIAQAVNYGLYKKGETYLDLNSCPVVKNIILPNYDSLFNTCSKTTQKIFNLHKVYEQQKNLAFTSHHSDIIKENRRFFYVHTTKKGLPQNEDWIFEMRGIYAILNALVDYEGNPRYNPITKEKPSNNWLIKNYFVHSPFHQQGGVARAILWNYIFPAFVANEWDNQYKTNQKDNKHLKWPRWSISPKNRGKLSTAQDKFFIHKRKLFRKAIKEILAFYRPIVKQIEKNIDRDLKNKATFTLT